LIVPMEVAVVLGDVRTFTLLPVHWTRSPELKADAIVAISSSEAVMRRFIDERPLGSESMRAIVPNRFAPDNPPNGGF
jgi:hypothetical protein